MTTRHDHPSLDALLTRHHGHGPLHAVCLPGLVPDGPETFARQLAVLLRHGSASVVTYPYLRFDLDQVLAAVAARVEEARSRGKVPVLVGVSVGGGLCLELLRRARAAGAPLRIGALVLVSPLSCTGDFAPLIRRLYEPIRAAHADATHAADSPTPEAAIERGRAFFQSLARGTTARVAPPPWLGALSLLTHAGRHAWREDRLRARIEATLAALPARGAVDRVLSLERLGGIVGPGARPAVLTTAPTLILWGSKERHTLSMDGPGTALLTRPDLATRIFPDVQVQWVYDRDGGEVPHAALIKHAPAFNALLGRFLHRQHAQVDRRRRRAQRRVISRFFTGRGLTKAG